MATAADTATSSCVTCSSGELATAKGFTQTRQAVDRYFTNVNNQWAKYSMPPMDSTLEWKAYRLSSKKMFKHFSLFFKCDSAKYQYSPGFTIELGISSRGTVIPITVLIDISTKDLSCLGTVTNSAEEIMNIGLECLEEFGDYDYYSNNCQKFCTKLAKKLDLEVPWTDSEKVLAWGVAGAIGIGLLGGIAALWSRGGKNSEEKTKRKY